MSAATVSEVSVPGAPVSRAARRRRWLVAPVVLLAVGGLALALALSGRTTDPIDEARAIVADDGNFATATDAGAAFTRV
jgi:hypothetical protein